MWTSGLSYTFAGPSVASEVITCEGNRPINRKPGEKSRTTAETLRSGSTYDPTRAGPPPPSGRIIREMPAVLARVLVIAANAPISLQGCPCNRGSDGRKAAIPTIAGPLDHFDGIRSTIRAHTAARLRRPPAVAVRRRTEQCRATYDSPFRSEAGYQCRRRAAPRHHGRSRNAADPGRGLNILTDPVWSHRASPFTFAGPAAATRQAFSWTTCRGSISCSSPITTTTTSIRHARLAPHQARAASRNAARQRPRSFAAPSRVPRVPSSTGATGSTSVRASSSMRSHATSWSARRSNDRRMALWAAFVIEDAGRQDLSCRRHRFSRRHQLSCGARKTDASASPTCPSAATSHAGSWPLSTRIREEAVLGMVACGAEYARSTLGHLPVDQQGVESRSGRLRLRSPSTVSIETVSGGCDRGKSSTSRSRRRHGNDAGTGNFGLFRHITARMKGASEAGARLDSRDNGDQVQLPGMNGLGNKILVVDMRGRKDRVTPQAAIALNADPATEFDQIMANHDPKSAGTDAWIDIVNSGRGDGPGCGNGTRCVVQALAAETGRKPSSSIRSRPLEAKEHDDGTISVDMASPVSAGDQIPLAEEFHDTRRIELQIGPIDAPVLTLPSGASMGNPPCDLLVGGRCVELRARPVRTTPREPFRSSPSAPISPSRASAPARRWTCGPGERGAGLTLACARPPVPPPSGGARTRPDRSGWCIRERARVRSRSNGASATTTSS